MKKLKILLGLFLSVLVGCKGNDTSFSSAEKDSSGEEISEVSTSENKYKPKEMTVYSINDLHGSLDFDKNNSELGIARLKYAIEHDSDYNPDTSIILCGGDSWQGGYYSFVDKPVTANLLDKLGVKAMAIGNHEWDWGVSTMQELQTYSSFPHLACNIIDKSTSKQVSWAVPSTSILTPGGLKLGVIGAIGVGQESDIKKSIVEGYTFSADKVYIENEVTKLQKDNCDLIVMLIHDSPNSGNNYISSIATIPGISGIFGAHTHQFEQQLVGSLPFVQAGSNSKGYAKIVFNVQTKSYKRFSYSNCYSQYNNVSEDKLDQEILKILKDEEETYEGNKGMGIYFDSTFSRYNHLYKWVTKAMIFQAQRQRWGSSFSGNELIAIHNPSGIRNNIPAGEVTRNILFKASPFNNNVVVVENVSGSDVIKFMGNDLSGRTNITEYEAYCTETDTPVSVSKTYDVVIIDYLSCQSYFLRYIKGEQKKLDKANNKDIAIPSLIVDYALSCGVRTFKASDYTTYL